MKKPNARSLPDRGIPPRPTRAIDIAAILVRNAIPIAGIVAFGWSAVQFLVLIVFNLALSIVNIGMAGVSAMTLRGDDGAPPQKIGFGDIANFLGVGLFFAAILTALGSWPIFIISGADSDILQRPNFWWSALAMVIASLPAMRAEIAEKVRSPLSMEQLKARDQPRVGIAFFGIAASLIMSGWTAQFGSIGLGLLVAAFTAFALVRELRPDIIAKGFSLPR